MRVPASPEKEETGCDQERGQRTGGAIPEEVAGIVGGNEAAADVPPVGPSPLR
jgi:hypothetical protein